ncbi:hypothetical protein AAVH_03334 [Aphelenchoides avenae]|nr:hypothetical protein AAVH_03334 [Aphelenchus avenae]
MKTRQRAATKKQDAEKSIFNLPWKNASRLKKQKGFVEVTEQVHYTFGWQRSGDVDWTISKNLNGVPVSVGSIKVLPNMYILEDQPCMHIDAEVQTIVFRGTTTPLECRVERVTRDYIVAKLYDIFSVIVRPSVPGATIGDTVPAKFQKFTFKGGLCQIQATPYPSSKSKR